MKKRIVSFLMALCMLALAVPVIALPATAAQNEEFTTKFYENYPKYTSGVSFDGYTGNWSLGYLTENGVYGEYTNLDYKYDILYADLGQWDGTGFYLSNTRLILCHNPFYASAKDDGTPLGDSKINKRAATMTYTSPYTGMATLSLDAFQPIDSEKSFQEEENRAYFAIFVNGKMVWPAKGDYFSNPDQWMPLSTYDDFVSYTQYVPIQVEVNRGDKIQFACAKISQAAELVYMTPTITFGQGYSVVSETQETTFSPSSTTWPEYYLVGGTFPLVQEDADWQMGSFNSTDKSFTAYKHQTNDGADAFAHGVPASGEGSLWGTEGGIYLDTSASNLLGGFKLGSTATVTPAYMFTSYAAASTVTPIVKSLKLTNAAGNLVKEATATVAVYVNGELKGSAEVTTHATTGVAAAPALSSFELKKGDEVVFTVTGVSDGVSCVTLVPSVKYEGVSSFLTETITSQYAIDVEKINLKVSAQGVALEFKAYANLALYDAASNVYIYVWEGDVAKTPENAAAKLEAVCDMSYAYVAEYSGFAIAELGDTVSYQVVAVNGTTVLDSSEVGTVVPATVALDTYNTTLKVEEKKLMAALLNYGAYAQTYFDHNTDALVNAGLPVGDRTLNTEANFSASYFVDPLTHLNICDAEIGAFSLIFENTVSIRVYLDTFPSEAGMDHVVQYGRTRDDGIDITAKKHAVDGKKSYIISDVGLNEMRDDFYIRVAVAYSTPGLNRKTYYYGYLNTYSIESYAARMIDLGTDANLCNLMYAMMAFGDLVAAQQG